MREGVAARGGARGSACSAPALAARGARCVRDAPRRGWGGGGAPGPLRLGVVGPAAAACAAGGARPKCWTHLFGVPSRRAPFPTIYNFLIRLSKIFGTACRFIFLLSSGAGARRGWWQRLFINKTFQSRVLRSLRAGALRARGVSPAARRPLFAGAQRIRAGNRCPAGGPFLFPQLNTPATWGRGVSPRRPGNTPCPPEAAPSRGGARTGVSGGGRVFDASVCVRASDGEHW